MEINPADQEVMSDDPTSSHAIQLDVQWDTPQYNASIVGAVVPCQSAYADWQNGGTISLSISDARAGLYRLQPRFNTPSGVLTHVTYQLYFDGIEVLSGERDVPGGYSGSFPYFNIDYTPPLASNYNLNLENNVSCILTPTAITISTFNDCSTGISWNKNTQSVNLTLTSGGEFVSFYDANQQMIGDNFSGTFSELQSTNVIQDSVYGDSEDKYFIVQCEWGGIVKTDSVRLLTQIGDVIVANTSGEDSLYTGQEVSVELYANDFGGACTIFFPFEATYNAEIIEGNEYGNLVEPYTGEHVQSFTELYHYFSYAYFDYVANGISPDTVKSVVIRISTSDPKIPSTDLILYIKPPPVYAYTVPDVVGADDTADVIIKHRLEDGTLEDFPPEQTFELAVLDGCVNGNFLVDTTVNVYFADALQPIKFVTADSLDSDSGYVRLRVGTDVEGFMRPISNIKGEEEKQLTESKREPDGNTGYTLTELRAGFEKMMEEKRAESLAEKLKTGGEPSPEVPIIEACALNQSARPFYWEWDEKYKTGNTLDHFEITIIPDTIAEKDTLAFSETAKLIIQAKDADSNDVDLEGEKLLTFKVVTNEDYGTFIDANGDTLKTTPVILEDVTYENAKNGLIKFAAVKENPDSVIKCLIKVVLEEDTTINGEREAVVLEQTLKIEMAGEYVVQPIITSEYDDMGSRAYQNAISEDNRKFFEVRLTRGGKLLINHRIKLSTNYVDESGGHDHILDRRPATSSNSNLTERYRRLHYGSFYSYSSGETFNIDSLKGMIYKRSRQDTVTRFEFVASIWGDEMKIYLESLENKILKKDSVTIIERIPDLQLLPDNANYDKVGGRCEHHGPRNDNAHMNCRTPDNNHYGPANTLQDIVAIANEWHATYPNEYILRINDISLPNGGKFDVYGSWRGPHQTHRNGEDIDIRTELHYYNRQGQVIHSDGGVQVRTPRTEPFNLPYVNNELRLNPNSTLIFNDEFQRICRNNNFRARVHLRNTTGEHYHLDYQN